MDLVKELSLRSRFILLGSLLVLVLLSVVNIGITRAFHDSVMQNAQSSLRNQVFLLLSTMDVVDGQIQMPSQMPDPRLSQLNSDLYAQIRDSSGASIWRSASLLDDEIVSVDSPSNEMSFRADARLSSAQAVYATDLRVEWETEQGLYPFSIYVAELQTGYRERLAEYNAQAWTLLAALGALILLALGLLFYWFLRPLNRIAVEISQVESGARRSFNEDYPVELNQLTHNLNLLLENEDRRIERHKEVLGNLAHSLKTPISILNGLNADQKDETVFKEQLRQMQSIIDYQLNAASTVGPRRFSRPINVSPITQKIVESLSKLHQDKNLRVSVEIAESVKFYGDEGDWHELLGNLLDNAFKWAEKQVWLSLHQLDAEPSPTAQRVGLRLTVADDGPGMAKDDAERIMQRGVRLDSQTPGHGLGLNIVKGIATAYGAELELVTHSGEGTEWQLTMV